MHVLIFVGTASHSDAAITFLQAPSKIVANAIKEKNDKYTPLCNRIRSLNAHDSASWKFLPLVLTHTGELSPEVFDLVEWFVGKFRVLWKRSPPDDGISLVRATARFRTNLLDRIMTALATWLRSSTACGWLSRGIGATASI